MMNALVFALALAASPQDAPPTERAPAAEAPAAEAPAAEAPAAEAPAAEGLAEEAPAPVLIEVTPTAPPPEEKSGPRIYVVDPAFVKLPAALKLTVSQAIASAIEKEGFSAITRDDVRTVLEQQADLAMLGGDADGASLAALGSAIGVQHVVAATLTSVDGDTLVQIRLIDSQKVAVLGRRELRASETGGELIRAVEDCARLAMQPLFSSGRGTLQLVVSEEGADVLVDGKQLAVSPMPPRALTLGMTTGWHLVTVSKQGFVSFQETLRVQNGETVERTAALAPSIQFLKEYQSRNGLYRTLAWTTTGLTTLSAAALAGSGAMLYVAVQQTAAKSAEVQQKIDAERVASGTARFNELQGEVIEVRNQEIPWAIAAPTSGAVMGVGALLAAYFWIFGDDPNRYEEYEREAGLR
jgi:hypothetical protein